MSTDPDANTPDPSLTADSSPDPKTDQAPGNMPAEIPAEIVRKVAEALTADFIARHGSADRIIRSAHYDTARRTLSIAAPLIAAQERERIATELHERAQEFVHATPESVAARHELMQAAKIAREAP